MDLVSVIIPVYNVEKYLDRCMRSVLEQTYTNLDIILVDDGSSDGSGIICDRYQGMDGRVRVIHKQNGGLSDARNAGIDAARADYLIFLDSDDFVDREYVSFLYALLREHDADISICRYMRFSGLEEIGKAKKGQEAILFSNTKALEALLYTPEVIPQSANAKMYKRELFDGVRYPVGKLHEDIGTTYKLLYKAKKIAYSASQYYFYFQRMDGIVHSEFTERKMDAVDFAEEILGFLEIHAPKLRNAAVCYAFSQNVQILMQLPLHDDRYKTVKKRLMDNIKKYRGTVVFDAKVTLPRRLGALAAYGNLDLVRRLGILYKRIINKEPV